MPIAWDRTRGSEVRSWRLYVRRNAPVSQKRAAGSVVTQEASAHKWKRYPAISAALCGNARCLPDTQCLSHILDKRLQQIIYAFIWHYVQINLKEGVSVQCVAAATRSCML